MDGVLNPQICPSWVLHTSLRSQWEEEPEMTPMDVNIKPHVHPNDGNAEITNTNRSVMSELHLPCFCDFSNGLNFKANYHKKAYCLLGNSTTVSIFTIKIR